MPKDWFDWEIFVKKFHNDFNINILDSPNVGRLCASVNVINNSYTGLLDSGACLSCMGGNTHKIFTSLGYKLSKCVSSVLTADNKPQKVIGKLSLSITYNNMSHVLEFSVIPSLGPGIILGIDFWKKSASVIQQY